MLSFQRKREKREGVIRSSLIERLKESVQSLIYGPGTENVPRLSSSSGRGQVLGHTDNTNALCSVLEAIFIHGLKDNLGERLSSFFLGDIDRMPVPNFWLVIMVISHKDLLEQVLALPLIVNDVGKGRAWLRLALNQGQLISYISVLASDVETLKDYYRPTALLREIESCDIMLRILQPLTGISFNLATNAAILNTWSQTPLVLSGTWIPAKFEESLGPVLSATDVASTFLEGECDEAAEGNVSLPQTPVSDQMFNLILGSTPETNFIFDGAKKVDEIGIQSTLEPRSSAKEMIVESHSSGKNVQIPSVDLPSSVYNPKKKTSPLDKEHEMEASHQEVTSEKFINRSLSIASDTNEYRSLLLEWENSETLSENLPAFLKTSVHLVSVPEPESSSLQQFLSKVQEEEDKEFEVLLPSKLTTEEELASCLPMLTVLMKEKGLDYQNYHCNGPSCSVPIGMIYGKPRLCKYDGKYYCYGCHQGDTSIIPARILHNWDFTLYPVCTVNKKWLDTAIHYPLLDIRLVNSKLYQHIDNLSELQMLRVQLHFIQAYLFTCSVDKGQELRKTFWPREYLYEHVHLYSVQDLNQVHEGKMVVMARQAVTKGTQHILNCAVCSPRGFICEVCRDSQIIYPFQLGNAFTCGSCCSVFHKTCVTKQCDCPRCKRFSSRHKEINIV